MTKRLVPGMGAAALLLFACGESPPTADNGAGSGDNGNGDNGNGSNGSNGSNGGGDGEADIRVIEASLSPEEVDAGSSTIVTARLENEGDARGEKLIELLVDNEVEEGEDVQLEAGEADEVDFNLSREEVGDYEVSVNGVDAGTVTFREPSPDIVVTEATLDPDDIPVNGSTTVTGTVENQGGETGDTTVLLKVGGEPVFGEDVEGLEPGEDTEVEFDHEPEEVGDHEIAVEDEIAGTLTVVMPDPEAIDDLEFAFGSSIVDTDLDALTDDSLIAVWAEDAAHTEDADPYRDEPDGGGPDIPLAAADESAGVVGFGSRLANNQTDVDDSRQLLINIWLDHIDGSGEILYDESHGQNHDLGEYGDLRERAEERGFAMEAIEEDFAGALEDGDADAVMITTVNDDIAEAGGFEADALEALADFAGEGGLVVLHHDRVEDEDSTDENGDATEELNEVLEELGADFRFNQDTVRDEENNTGGEPPLVRTQVFNENAFPAFFGPE